MPVRRRVPLWNAALLLLRTPLRQAGVPLPDGVVVEPYADADDLDATGEWVEVTHAGGADGADGGVSGWGADGQAP